MKNGFAVLVLNNKLTEKSVRLMQADQAGFSIDPNQRNGVLFFCAPLVLAFATSRFSRADVAFSFSFSPLVTSQSCVETSLDVIKLRGNRTKDNNGKTW